MSVQVEDLSPVEKKLSFVVEPAKVDEKLDEAYKILGKQVQMKGFRPGKVPRRILEKRFGRHIQGEVAGGVISEAFDDAVEEHGFTPVTQPIIEQGKLAAGEEFTFSVTVEVKPEVPLEVWEGIDVEWESVEVAEDQVETELDNLRQRAATLEVAPEGHEATDGDFVIVDGSFAVEGVDEPRKMEGMMVVIGQPTGLPSADWLAPKVVGMKVGDTKDESDDAPENGLGEGYDGKTGALAITVTEIKTKKLPELDDDFAGDMGHDSLDMLKADLRFRIEESMRSHAREHAAHHAVEYVIENNPFDVPLGLVRNQAEQMLREQWQQFAQQGMNMPAPTLDALPEDLRDRRIAEGEFHVKRSLVLEAIAKAAELEVGEAEVDARIDQMAEEMGRHPSAIKGLLLKNNGLEGLKERLLEEQALDCLLERANVIDIEPGACTHHSHDEAEEPAAEEPAAEEPVEAPVEEPAAEEPAAEEPAAEEPAKKKAAKKPAAKKPAAKKPAAKKPAAKKPAAKKKAAKKPADEKPADEKPAKKPAKKKAAKKKPAEAPADAEAPEVADAPAEEEEAEAPAK